MRWNNYLMSGGVDELLPASPTIRTAFAVTFFEPQLCLDSVRGRDRRDDALGSPRTVGILSYWAPSPLARGKRRTTQRPRVGSGDAGLLGDGSRSSINRVRCDIKRVHTLRVLLYSSTAVRCIIRGLVIFECDEPSKTRVSP